MEETKGYEVGSEILEKYADVLVNFALNDGGGVKKGEVVIVNAPECARSMLLAVRRAVLKAGGHVIMRYRPDDIMREFYEVASQEQIEFFPKHFCKGVVNEADHFIMIVAETDKHELEGIKPKKIMDSSKAMKPYKDWRDEKENKGKLTWTLGLYGTQAMADEVGLSLEEYWDEIIKACYLDKDDPVSEWKSIFEELERVKAKLDSLKIEKVHVVSEGTDIKIKIGGDRKWMTGSGNNIPSFEVFVSPDYRGVEGHMSFDQPLYSYGNLIENVYLEFKDGKVVKASASKGEDVLKEMIAVEGADQVGEFSLTDARLSRITKFMGETLYDENVGGKYGNCHIALGSAYKDSYDGDKTKLKKADWDKIGYNDSVVHTDIMSTQDRVVTATLADGSEMVLYKGGRFVI